MQVLCGDWKRCVTTAALHYNFHEAVGIFLDPPYGEGDGVAYEDRTGTVAHEVWEWAVKHGQNPKRRIVVAGYEDGRTIPADWHTIDRTENGGYGSSNGNRHRERLWLSPHCQSPRQTSLF